MAVVGARDWAMTLPAAGVPVVNSVVYHPQPALWSRLDPTGAQRPIYNRYQRLMFELGVPARGASQQIQSPRLDEVRVTLEPAHFDFRTLGARWVLMPAADGSRVAGNPTLARIATGEGAAATPYALFAVKP